MMKTLEQMLKKARKLGEKNRELNERLNTVTAERDRLKSAQPVCPQCARKPPPRKFRRIDDPDILDKMLIRRRDAMFRAFKAIEPYERVEQHYSDLGEDIPEDVILAATNISRSKWAVQGDFLSRFNKGEQYLAQEPLDA